MTATLNAAYGGEGWSPRGDGLARELGRVWAGFAVGSEWLRLNAVLMHRPGDELAASRDPHQVQMLAPVDLARAGRTRVEREFSREAIMSQYLELYRRLTGS